MREEMTRNEAADRLRQVYGDFPALDEALATERRLTVERMAKDVEARIRSGAYLTYHAGPSNLVRDSADSILDDLVTADVDEEEGK